MCCVLTLREALLFPRCLTEGGWRDENDPVLRDIHGPQVLHDALQIRHVLVQGDVLLESFNPNAICLYDSED